MAGAPFKRLPVLADFPLEHVPRAPYPNDSELYNIIRTRVRNEVRIGFYVFGVNERRREKRLSLT